MSDPFHDDAPPPAGELARLRVAAREGERASLDDLFEQIYQELHALAHRQLDRSRPGETLGTTALVHEAYLKLVAGGQTQVHDRRHFFALAARAMRQIILDYARSAQAQKRGGEATRVDLDAALLGDGNSQGELTAAELVALDQALTALEELSERLARVVELRFFAGLSVEETGEVLALSPRTVKRDWRKARAFLFQALKGIASP